MVFMNNLKTYVSGMVFLDFISIKHYVFIQVPYIATMKADDVFSMIANQIAKKRLF